VTGLSTEHEANVFRFEGRFEPRDHDERDAGLNFKYNTLATYNSVQAQYELAGELPPYPVRRRRRRHR
jgi:hypothetical protein